MSGKSTGTILINLQKVFDTLHHDILLNKIKYLGFKSKTLHWFDSCLKKRNIVINFDKTLSEEGILNCGVPQGSILGLILFLLYVNDMKTAMKNCDLRQQIICLYFIAAKMSSSLKEILIMILTTFVNGS